MANKIQLKRLEDNQGKWQLWTTLGSAASVSATLSKLRKQYPGFLWREGIKGNPSIFGMYPLSPSLEKLAMEKWQAGRENYGEEFVGDPYEESRLELADYSNYIFQLGIDNRITTKQAFTFIQKATALDNELRLLIES